ncbi:MAG: hypothetical protein ACRC67_44995 [Inquilinus sp.]|uniref:hypothetical protein n=1 Tax=Inquilinus sp. TaxID=1932117 RepID=UPI003F2BBF80
MAVTADQITVEITAVYDQYERTMVQVAAVTSRNMAAAEDSAKKGGDAIEKALEKAASRLPGLIKNLAEGQNALHLFLQEGAEFLSIFGVWGTVLGGAVGAVDAIAGAMGAYETAADRAAAAQKAFDQAMRDTKGILTESEQAAVDLASGLSLVEKGLLATAAQEIDDAIRAQKDQLDDLRDSAKGAAGVLRYALSDKIKAGVATPEEQEADRIASDLQDGIPQTSAQFDALLARLRELRPSLTDAGRETGSLATELAGVSSAAAGVETKTAVSIKVQERMAVVHKEGAEAADGAGQSAQNLGRKFGGAADRVLTLAEALKVFSSEATRARSAGVQVGVDLDKLEQRILAETEAYRKGKDAVDARNDALAVEKVRSEALAAAQKSGLGVNDAKAEADRIAAEERTRLQERKAFEERERLRRATSVRAPRSTGVAAAPDAGANDPVASLRQQADLNERLLLVYQRGADAQAAMKAQVEALNSARQRGLELGTAEHAQYVQHYEDEAARKRRSDQLLADYAKADQLVEGAMTSQEKYEAAKVEYARLHKEGAFTDAEYSRVLEKLNLENQGYVEGIQAIGQAIQNGIQGATSFSDALTKVGMALAQMLLQAALFGGGPLGKAFGSLTGLSGGLLGLAFGGGGAVGYDGGTGLGPIGPGGIAGHAAMGGQALPGRLYEVGETGREWFAPSVPGQVIPNHVIKAAAGGGGGSSQPITFNISMAGANGDRAIAEIAATAVKRGLAGVPEINRQHRIRFA